MSSPEISFPQSLSGDHLILYLSFAPLKLHYFHIKFPTPTYFNVRIYLVNYTNHTKYI